jgi:hypothetical protein
MADVSLNAVKKLVVDFGAACEKFHDEHVRNVRVRRLQADEIWCFVGAKAKNVTPEQKAQGWGDTWTWTGLDADTKLCVSYLVGGRSANWAIEFMPDCATRIKGHVQITTDGHKAYLVAVENRIRQDLRLRHATEDLRRTSRERYALFPSNLRWVQHEGCQRRSRSEARQYVLRGTQ